MSKIVLALIILFFLIGLFSVLTKKNMLKVVMGLAFMEYAVSLFIILSGYKWGGHVPVINDSLKDWTYVDPLAQAMVVTTIIIGLASISVFAALSLRLYEKFGTFDIDEIKRLKG
jgi:multicomponent Na+:H+ antiporter subunit C